MLWSCDGEGYVKSGHKLWEYEKYCTYFYGLSGDLVQTMSSILGDRISLEKAYILPIPILIIRSQNNVSYKLQTPNRVAEWMNESWKISYFFMAERMLWKGSVLYIVSSWNRFHLLVVIYILFTN